MISPSGLPILVDFLEPQYDAHKELILVAIDGIWKIFTMETVLPKNDFCRLFAKVKLLNRLSSTRVPVWGR